MPTYLEVRKIKEKHEKRFLKMKGVTAVGVGRKGTTDAYCIRVFISGDTDPDKPLPSTIEGVEVEVVLTDPIKAFLILW